MADKGPKKTTGSAPPPDSASSEDFPVTGSHEYHPSGYSYVELVSDIQNRLGRLSEAVDTLKIQTAANGTKLSEIASDIHTAKITLKIASGILAALLAFACWLGNKAVDAFLHSRESAPTTILTPKR